MARAKRFPSEVVARIDSLIRREAFAQKVKDESYKERGLTNSTIVSACLGEARDIMRRQYDEMVSGYLAIRIPLVLPEPSETEPTRYLTLPGLDLPAWLSVPPEDKGEFGWKFQPDVTPNQLTRLIDHRQKDIDGRIAEKQKLAILRDTAVELGCDPDDPISKVFDRRSLPTSPEDKPHSPIP